MFTVCSQRFPTLKVTTTSSLASADGCDPIHLSAVLIGSRTDRFLVGADGHRTGLRGLPLARERNRLPLAWLSVCLSPTTVFGWCCFVGGAAGESRGFGVANVGITANTRDALDSSDA